MVGPSIFGVLGFIQITIDRVATRMYRYLLRLL